MGRTITGVTSWITPSIWELHHPSGFEQHFAQILTPKAFWQLVLNMSSPHDQRIYKQAVFASAYQRALQEGLQQGEAGYARDLLNALSPWPFALETLEVPTHLWYGQQDQRWVHSPNFGATLAQRLPRAKWHLDSAEGGSILWTHSEPILASLKADLI